jgi:GABA(A) receptor-associated protein
MSQTPVVPKIRVGEVERLRAKFPERLPIMVTRSPHSPMDTPEIRKHKFLVPNDFRFSDVLTTIRKWLALPPEKALFLFVVSRDKSETIPSPTAMLVDLHEAHAARNGVLYMMYALENTFGGGAERPPHAPLWRRSAPHAPCL